MSLLVKKSKSRPKERPDPVLEKHKKWVKRTFQCVVCVKGFPTRDLLIDPHHVRNNLPPGVAKGTGLKPLHSWVVPLCRTHHDETEGINSGIHTFETKYGVSLAEIAAECWQKSPYRHEYERKLRA